MLLHDSRRAARASAGRRADLLEEQDRSLWNREQIEEGIGAGRAGTLVAALRALLAAGRDRGGALRGRNGRRYRLERDRLSLRPAAAHRALRPIVELNRAVAVAMRDGPAAGLALIDELLAQRRSRRNIGWPTRRAPTSAAASADRPRPGNRIGARWR